MFLQINVELILAVLLITIGDCFKLGDKFGNEFR